MKANKFFAIALAALTLGFVACKDKEPQADKLSLNKTEVTIAVDETVQLTANLEVAWASSNEAVATVEAGLVKGIAAGEANITAKAGDQTAVCKVTVKEGGVTPPPSDVPEINVEDNSLADWDALPAEFVVEAVCPEEAAMLGLKSVKVYSTEMYLYVLVEPNMDDITDLEWVPFHMYINADGSDETGGYGDEFADANAEWLLEGSIYAEGNPYSYNPAVFSWWGEVGGSGWDWTDPSVEHDASDFWGAIIGEGQLPVGQSQCVDGKHEIRILKELISEDFADEFGIGFDIQQNWSSVGVLPCVAATDENPNGYTAKLRVKVNK